MKTKITKPTYRSAYIKVYISVAFSCYSVAQENPSYTKRWRKKDRRTVIHTIQLCTEISRDVCPNSREGDLKSSKLPWQCNAHSVQLLDNSNKATASCLKHLNEQMILTRETCSRDINYFVFVLHQTTTYCHSTMYCTEVMLNYSQIPSVASDWLL